MLFAGDGACCFVFSSSGVCVFVLALSPRGIQHSSSLTAFSKNKTQLWVLVYWYFPLLE